MPRIDALGPDEGERLRRLRLAALQADPDSFYRTFAEEVDQPLSFWDAWLARDGACVVVAVLDGRDVGLGGLVPGRQAPDELAVVTFWVDQAARGAGWVAPCSPTSSCVRVRSAPRRSPSRSPTPTWPP